MSRKTDDDGKDHKPAEKETPADRYNAAVEAVAAGAKKLIDAGLGATVAGPLAFDLWRVVCTAET